MTLEIVARDLYHQFGQRKSMGGNAPNTRLPHFFLLRTFRAENDLLVILNTKRCAYQCHFCQLPMKSSRVWIPEEDILAQFEFVLHEVKHSLSILDRVTLSNEGSVLDEDTFPPSALLCISRAVQELRRVRTLVLETRLEYVDPTTIRPLQEALSRANLNILTGFETLDQGIRDRILFKREPLTAFLVGLDRVAEAGADLTSYVLYKPSPTMTDNDAMSEAENTIDYLVQQCHTRAIRLTIRLNPMYLAQGSKWAEFAKATPEYKPPRLTDVMKLAEKKTQEGVEIYIGLSTEGLADFGGSFMAREDYSPRLIKAAQQFNDGKLARFDWTKILGTPG